MDIITPVNESQRGVDEEDNNEYGDKNDATIMMIITMMMKMPAITMTMKIIIPPVNESPCEVEEVGGSPVAAPSHSCEHKYKVNCIWKYGCVYTTNTEK